MKSDKDLAADILGPMTADDAIEPEGDEMMDADPMQMAASEVMTAMKTSDVGALAEALRAAIMSAQLAKAGDED